MAGQRRSFGAHWGGQGVCSCGFEYRVHHQFRHDRARGIHALHLGIYVHAMRLPWISRSSHQEMMALLTTQLDELTHERRVLLDRLATLGLGGPLFSLASSEASSEGADPVDPEAEEIESLLHARRRPSKLADALTRKA